MTFVSLPSKEICEKEILSNNSHKDGEISEFAPQILRTVSRVNGLFRVPLPSPLLGGPLSPSPSSLIPPRSWAGRHRAVGHLGVGDVAVEGRLVWGDRD